MRTPLLAYAWRNDKKLFYSDFTHPAGTAHGVYGSEYDGILVDTPVTWTSQPEYDMDTEGEYVFTPVIEGYTVSATCPELL